MSSACITFLPVLSRSAGASCVISGDFLAMIPSLQEDGEEITNGAPGLLCLVCVDAHKLSLSGGATTECCIMLYHTW